MAQGSGLLASDEFVRAPEAIRSQYPEEEFLQSMSKPVESPSIEVNEYSTAATVALSVYVRVYISCIMHQQYLMIIIYKDKWTSLPV
jgi:hypothetical protein